MTGRWRCLLCAYKGWRAGTYAEWQQHYKDHYRRSDRGQEKAGAVGQNP